jgi:hypothetical protein
VCQKHLEIDALAKSGGDRHAQVRRVASRGKNDAEMGSHRSTTS